MRAPTAVPLPQPDAVRLEEMINYFPYDYPAPTSLDTPFKATMTVFPIRAPNCRPAVVRTSMRALRRMCLRWMRPGGTP